MFYFFGNQAGTVEIPGIECIDTRPHARLISPPYSEIGIPSIFRVPFTLSAKLNMLSKNDYNINGNGVPWSWLDDITSVEVGSKISPVNTSRHAINY